MQVISSLPWPVYATAVFVLAIGVAATQGWISDEWAQHVFAFLLGAASPSAVGFVAGKARSNRPGASPGG